MMQKCIDEFINLKFKLFFSRKNYSEVNWSKTKNYRNSEYFENLNIY